MTMRLQDGVGTHRGLIGVKGAEDAREFLAEGIVASALGDTEFHRAFVSAREDDKFSAVSTKGLLKFKSFKPLALKTLISERQLHDFGLCLVGDEDVQRWLVPIDAVEVTEGAYEPDWLPSLKSRVDELRELAHEEGLPFSEESAEQAIAFVTQLRDYHRPSAFLIGNGNVRLLWASSHGEQIGLQFLGKFEVQYLLMARRESRLATVMGADQIDSIMRYIQAAGLAQLFRR